MVRSELLLLLLSVVSLVRLLEEGGLGGKGLFILAGEGLGSEGMMMLGSEEGGSFSLELEEEDLCLREGL